MQCRRLTKFTLNEVSIVDRPANAAAAAAIAKREAQDVSKQLLPAAQYDQFGHVADPKAALAHLRKQQPPGPVVKANSAADELDRLAKKRQRETDLDYDTAYDVVCDEWPDLYAQAIRT